MRKIPFDKAKLEEIAAKWPTPFHIYDAKAIRENAKRLKKAFAWNKGFREYFAVKAAPNPHLMKLLKEFDFGSDCSSMAELVLAEKVGNVGDRIMFTSNDTPAEEFRKAWELGAIINLDDITHWPFVLESVGRPQAAELGEQGGCFGGRQVARARVVELRHGKHAATGAYKWVADSTLRGNGKIAAPFEERKDVVNALRGEPASEQRGFQGFGLCGRELFDGGVMNSFAMQSVLPQKPVDGLSVLPGPRAVRIDCFAEGDGRSVLAGSTRTFGHDFRAGVRRDVRPHAFAVPAHGFPMASASCVGYVDDVRLVRLSRIGRRLSVKNTREAGLEKFSSHTRSFGLSSSSHLASAAAIIFLSAFYPRTEKGSQISLQPLEISGAPSRIRTCDPLLRRQLLYPAEL